MNEEIHYSAILQYLNQQAPVLFLRLDKNGNICNANRFATTLIGKDIVGKNVQDIIVDFHHEFQIDRIENNPDTVHLLTIASKNAPPQSYHFHLYHSQNSIIAFGHLDVEEISYVSNALVSTNQELNNLTRQLNRKNQELIRANETITELTRTDPLTQLANRRYFNERIEQTISLANRKSQPLSLIMTDIDKFKTVNDTFGHDAGDVVLKGYADLMKKNTRVEDLVARFGGEEFIILLPLTDAHDAYIFSERIRKALSITDLIGNNHLITASYGVSQLMPDEGSMTFIKRADTALYRAKKTGRNRTVIAETENQSSSDKL